MKAALAQEFGAHELDQKIENFVAIGFKPFSVLAYHNQFFDEARRAFVIGAYYPALVGACALGERILNHLILDLRNFYKHTPEYKRVYRKESFDDWQIPIDTLQAWNVLLPSAVTEFQALKALRHRSIHFNVSTYATLRHDALHHMREIIDRSLPPLATDRGSLRGREGTFSSSGSRKMTRSLRSIICPHLRSLAPTSPSHSIAA